MYFTKTPKIIRSIFKDAIWNLEDSINTVYLTFDDGPTPKITDETLDTLKFNEVPATFFCLGKQVEKNPELYIRIREEGHTIGNHSFSHLKGWDTKDELYFNDIQKAQKLIDSTLFRPPYGKITRSQLKQLKKQFDIIMWDVLPGDFSPKTSEEEVIKNVIDNVVPGSIIVLHDNDKCGNKMNKALPEIIRLLKAKGFVFDSL